MNRPSDESLVEAWAMVESRDANERATGLAIISTELRRLRDAEAGYTGTPPRPGRYLVLRSPCFLTQMQWDGNVWEDVFTTYAPHEISRWWHLPEAAP